MIKTSPLVLFNMYTYGCRLIDLGAMSNICLIKVTFTRRVSVILSYELMTVDMLFLWCACVRVFLYFVSIFKKTLFSPVKNGFFQVYYYMCVTNA